MDASFRAVTEHVLVRSGGEGEADRFERMGKEYPVVVLLDTHLGRIRITLNKGVNVSAIEIAKELWGGGCVGNDVQAVSPADKRMYITDANQAADRIKL